MYKRNVSLDLLIVKRIVDGILNLIFNCSSFSYWNEILIFLHPVQRVVFRWRITRPITQFLKKYWFRHHIWCVLQYLTTYTEINLDFFFSLFVIYKRPRYTTYVYGHQLVLSHHIFSIFLYERENRSFHSHRCVTGVALPMSRLLHMNGFCGWMGD